MASSWPATASLGHLVDLGDQRDDRRLELLELADDVLVARPDLLVGRHAETDDVDLGQRRAYDVVEPLAEQGARLVQPRGVDQDQLGVLAVHDAAYGVPGGLRPVGGDGDLLPHQGVGQRRLAGVGPADEAGEPGAELCLTALLVRRRRRPCRASAVAPHRQPPHALAGEAGPLERALLGDVVDLGVGLDPVGGRGREQVAGQLALGCGAVARDRGARAAADADLPAPRGSARPGLDAGGSRRRRQQPVVGGRPRRAGPVVAVIVLRR